MKFFNQISIFLLTLSCSSVQKNNPLAITGQNDLESETEVFLYEVIGRLSDGRVDCTAFVSGPREITTAAHCVEKLDLEKSKFYTANFYNGLSTKRTILDKDKDYAALQVDTIFEKSLSFGDLVTDDASIVVYDKKSNSLMVDKSCTVKRDKNYAGLLVHTCDSLPGMSGSPILQKGKVVGIHLGSLPYYKNSNAALESSRRFDNAVKINRSFIKDEGLFGRCAPWCNSDDPFTHGATGLSDGAQAIADGLTHSLNVGGSVARKIFLGGEKAFKGVVGNLPWLQEAIVAAGFLSNGYMCIQSAGSSPGYQAPTPDGQIYCSQNACACTAVLGYLIAKRNWPQDKEQTSKIVNHPNFQNAPEEDRRETLLAVTGAIPQGYFFDANGIGVYWSNGDDAYCWITTPKNVGGPAYRYQYGINPHTMTKMRADGACAGQT